VSVFVFASISQRIIVVGVGTFAVVSLMIGTAISDAGCDSHVPLTVDDLNTSNISSTTPVSVSTSSPGRGVSPEMQCRVGVAVALTFLAGIYQVSFPPELSQSFSIGGQGFGSIWVNPR